MPEKRLEFRYKINDVASAQRTRFLHSLQLKLLLGIWLISIVLIMIPLLLPNLLTIGQSYNWALVLEISIAYVVTMVVLLFITPYLDFLFRRFWHLPLQLQFNEKQMRVSVSGGKSPGLRLQWGQIRRVDENRRVMILTYGDGGKFVIIPKSAFSRTQDDRRFRDLLRKRASIPVEEDKAAEENPAAEGQDVQKK